MTLSPSPATWALLQGAAALTALLLLCARSTSARLRAPFAIAVAAAPLGAIALDLALRTVGWALASPRPAMPSELGASSFGALAATCAVLALLSRARGIAPLAALDQTTPALAAMIAVGRVGCLAVGCEHGKPSSLPWAVRYAGDGPALHDHLRRGLVDADAVVSLPVHPTAAYEIVVALVALLAAMLDGRRRGRRVGDTFVWAATVWCVGRAGVEIVRDDVGRGALGPLTTGQMLALAAGLVVLEVRRRGARPAASRLTLDEERQAVPAPTADVATVSCDRGDCA